MLVAARNPVLVAARNPVLVAARKPVLAPPLLDVDSKSVRALTYLGVDLPGRASCPHAPCDSTR